MPTDDPVAATRETGAGRGPLVIPRCAPRPLACVLVLAVAVLSTETVSAEVVLSTADGRELASMPLASRRTGGEEMTPPGVARRRATRVDRLLREGRFVALVAVPEFDGGTGEGTAAGVCVRFEPDASVLVAGDPTAGRELLRETLPGYPAHPYCCGAEPGDGPACLVSPAVYEVWLDAGGRYLLARVGTNTGVPDGCDEGIE
jgi:hypothetical protein